jgi:gliding motility-associated lipoprotein GldH
MMYRVIFWSLGILLAWGCDKTEYQASVKYYFEEDQINRLDTLIFTFNIEDTLGQYDLGMNVNYNYIDYPFQNIYFKVKTEYPSGKIQEELLNLDFSTKQGIVKGDCMGSTCNLPLYLQRRIHFNEVGSYKIQLVQSTRQESIHGIKFIELYLKPEEL